MRRGETSWPPFKGRGLVEAEERPGEIPGPSRDAAPLTSARKHDELPAVPGAPLASLDKAGALEQRKLLGEDGMIPRTLQEALQGGEAVGIEGGESQLQIAQPGAQRLGALVRQLVKAASFA